MAHALSDAYDRRDITAHALIALGYFLFSMLNDVASASILIRVATHALRYVLVKIRMSGENVYEICDHFKSTDLTLSFTSQWFKPPNRLFMNVVMYNFVFSWELQTFNILLYKYTYLCRHRNGFCI